MPTGLQSTTHVWGAWDHEIGRREGGQHLGAEDLRERRMVEEVGGFPMAPLGAPESALGVDRARGHGQMHMGMGVEPACGGVQHRHGTGSAL